MDLKGASQDSVRETIYRIHIPHYVKNQKKTKICEICRQICEICGLLICGGISGVSDADDPVDSGQAGVTIGANPLFDSHDA